MSPFPFPARVLGCAALSLFTASGAPALQAQAASGSPPTAASPAGGALPLDRVVVKGQALLGANAPFSTVTLDSGRIRDLRVNRPEDLFREVPGMAVRNLGLSGVADSIVLRGFGGGGHGGDLGVVLDGLPLNEAMSHADGYVDLTVVVPLEIAAMTVYKGPVSALYGNYNRSGLIALETRKDGNYGQTDLSVADNGTLDAQAALGVSPAPGHRLHLAGQHFRTDGFRPQSQFDRTTLAARWAMDLAPTTQVALAARYYTGEGESASYLTRTQFERDPYGIDARVQNDGSEKEFATVRADAATQLGGGTRALAFAYVTQQSFTRWFTRPINPTAWAQREEAYDRDVWGAGFNLNGRRRLPAGPLNWVAGAETFRESTDFRFFDGLANRQRLNPAIYDRTADLDGTAFFGELEAPVHTLFKPWVALRHDRFDGEAVRRGAETGGDPVGPMQKLNHTSPKLGVRSDVAPGVELRASWAEGFALPSNFAKYALGAANVDPNTFRQTEVGARWRLGSSLTLDAAYYHLQSSDEIAAVGGGLFQNFGATERTGFEARAEWRPRSALLFSAAYGRAESEIERNVNAALVGREVTGVPDDTVTLGALWSPRTGWGGGATLRYMGRYAVDAPNTRYAASYTTLDLTVSYAGLVSGRRYKVYAALDNALDRKHATSVSLIGGSEVIAPGAPLTWKTGVQFDF